MSADENTLVPTGLAWHYSSAAGLRGIIESNALRATSAAFMNDANEMRTGVNALKGAYERLKPNLSAEERELVERGRLLDQSRVFDSFLVSASLEPDLLTLWRYYGNDNVAYSIGLDRETLLVPRARLNDESHPSPPPGYFDGYWDEVDGERVNLVPNPDYVLAFGGKWHEVAYVRRDGGPLHEAQIKEYIEAQKEIEAKGRWMPELGAFADSSVNLEKDDGFADEKELRIILELNPAWKFVRFRESRFGLVPYIELTAPNGPDEMDFVPADANSRLPIRHILVGPTSAPEPTKRALRLFLDNSGYGDVTIGSSEIPFR